jgi:hypothetical protein
VTIENAVIATPGISRRNSLKPFLQRHTGPKPIRRELPYAPHSGAYCLTIKNTLSLQFSIRRTVAIGSALCSV